MQGNELIPVLRGVSHQWAFWFALAAAAALLHLDPGGRIDRARLALAGVGGAPYTPAWLEEGAVGEAPGEELFARIGERVRDEVEPFDDIHAPVAYRKRLARVLTARTLASATALAANGAAA
jgi:carbon-monoxide dehydrogenase medium subunit